MKHATIKASDKNGVKLITFNRPEARNAFNKELREAFIEELRSAKEDDCIKTIILTGEGTSFSSGIDTKELANIQQKDVPSTDQDTSWNVLNHIRDFPKFVFMAVNGVGVGLGTTILGFADIAIACESARFKCPFTELGVGAEASSTWLLPQLVGWQNAAWMLLSSEWIDAKKAKEMGLVYDVVADDKLLEKTMEMAEKIATRDLASLLANKETMISLRKDFVTAAAKEEGKRFMELINERLL